MKNKIGSILLSVAVAFFLWYYVISVVSPGSTETIYDIPVVFEGETVLTEDRGMMITSRAEEVTVDLRLSGNRTDLAKVNKGNITIKVNLARVYDPGQHELTYDIIFPGDVPVGALTTELKTPEAIKLTVEKRDRKPVEVRVNFNGSAAQDFMADTENRILDYPTVNVSGPSSVIELIDHARIDVDLTGRMESISENFRYTLCDADGKPVDVEMVTTDVGEIHLDMKIIRIKQIPLTMSLNYGGGALEDTVEVTIEPANITVSGSETLLEDLEFIQLGALDLFLMEEDMEATYAIPIPEGITNLSERTEAKVTVKFKDLAIKELEINKINMVGVPEGMEAELLNQVLKVRLRGPAAVMGKLEPEHVVVTVDFSGKELGSFTIKPTITIPGADYVKVGAVGTYSVSATLREAPPEETEG